MIVKLLGLLDLLTAIAAVFVQIGFLPAVFLKFFIFYLIVKGAVFIKSFSSIGDLLCAGYLIAMAFGARTFLVYILALFLFQKAVFSFAS